MTRGTVWPMPMMPNALKAASLALAALVLLAGAALPQVPQFVPRDENPEDFPVGPGREETFYACTACHGFKLVAQQGMNRRQWEESLEWMTEKHGMPPLPEKELKLVLDYLEKTYPPRAPEAARGWQNPVLQR
jgi:mono/diheme cytochrome c family protein